MHPRTRGCSNQGANLRLPPTPDTIFEDPQKAQPQWFIWMLVQFGHDKQTK